MTHWTAQRVLDAAAAWVWVPDDAVEVRTADYQLIRYPGWVLDPTFPAAQVGWSATARPLDEVASELAGQVRGWGLAEVDWWITAATRPADTEAFLVAQGAELTYTVQVLGCPLDEGLPRPDLPAEGFTDFGQQRRYRLAIG